MSGENQCCGNCHYGAPRSDGYVDCVAPVPKCIHSATPRYRISISSGHDCDCWAAPVSVISCPPAPVVNQ